MGFRTLNVLLAFALGLAAASAGAEDWRRAEPGGFLRGATDAGWFTEQERRMIRSYFDRHRSSDRYRGERDRHRGGPPHGKGRGRSRGLPPGLAKRDRLPPGLEKHGRLPPRLEKQALPSELESRLPSRRGRYERALVDGRVLLIDRITRRIVDIIQDVRARR